MTEQHGKGALVFVLLGMLSACACFAQDENGGTNDVGEVYTPARYELIVERAPFGTERSW